MEKLKLNREGFLVSKTQRQCTNCRIIFKNNSKTVTLCPTCNTTRVKSLSLETKMRNRAQQRAKNSGLEFDLKKEDIKIPTICPVFNTPLISHSGSSGGTKYSPSLDRKDPSKGYTKDNIQVISQLANAMKANATKEELLKFAEWILRTYKN